MFLTGLVPLTVPNTVVVSSSSGNIVEQASAAFVRKDHREAARLYRLAADQGNADGQSHLGELYWFGQGGLPKDEREAARLFRLAADQGDAGSQNDLGFLYEHSGGGLPKNEREAARLYRLAADQGNAGGQINSRPANIAVWNP
jgi:TPR repeat protein